MNNSLFEIKDLENAYVKFKSYVYYNNTDINNKIKIAEFEQNISIKLEALLEILNNESSIDKYLKDVKYYLLPKSFERFVESDDCLIISNKNISSEYELSKYNFFIDMPIELHIINVLWILKLGYMLDLDNCEYCITSKSYVSWNKRLSLLFQFVLGESNGLADTNAIRVQKQTHKNLHFFFGQS